MGFGQYLFSRDSLRKNNLLISLVALKMGKMVRGGARWSVPQRKVWWLHTGHIALQYLLLSGPFSSAAVAPVPDRPWRCMICGAQQIPDNNQVKSENQHHLREVSGWARKVPGPGDTKAHLGRDRHHGFNPVIMRESSGTQ